MNAYADKKQENKSQSVAISLNSKKSSNPTFQFMDNRPEAIRQMKLQQMADNYSAQHQKPIQTNENELNGIVSKRVVQGKFKLVGSDDPNAEFNRKDNTHLNEIKRFIEPLKDTCLYEFKTNDFSAKNEQDEQDRTVKAKVTIPNTLGNSSDKAANLNSTVHELTHAQAILRDSYIPHINVFHVLYEQGILKLRELIPLEEALTVGFENSNGITHEIRSTDTYKLLQYFTKEDWVKLVNPSKAPAIKSRFEGIYPQSGPRNDKITENIVENTVREHDKRKSYVKDASLDEAWDPPQIHSRSNIDPTSDLGKGRKSLLSKTHEDDKNDLELAKKFEKASDGTKTLQESEKLILDNYIRSLESVITWAKEVLKENGKDMVEVDYVMKRSKAIKNEFNSLHVSKKFQESNEDNIGPLF